MKRLREVKAQPLIKRNDNELKIPESEKNYTP